MSGIMAISGGWWRPVSGWKVGRDPNKGHWGISWTLRVVLVPQGKGSLRARPLRLKRWVDLLVFAPEKY